MGLIVLHMHPPLINAAITQSLKDILGQFSMEIFMVASGFLFGIARLEIYSLSDYSAFITKKFKRLMVPYFVLAGIILLLKFPAQQFVTLFSPVTHDFWKHIFFDPVGGFATFLWFLYILFFIFLIFPILQKILCNSMVLFLFLLIMYLIPIPSFSYFNHYLLRWFILFFYSGYVFSRCKIESVSVYSPYLFIILSVLVVLLTRQRGPVMDSLRILIGYKLANNLLKLIIALMGTFAYYYLSVLIKKYKNPLFHMLKYLGTYSTSIYLLHTISMASIRILCLDILDLNVKLFPLVSVLIFISGIMLPIFITKYIIDKFDILPPLILGVKKPL